MRFKSKIVGLLALLILPACTPSSPPSSAATIMPRSTTSGVLRCDRPGIPGRARGQSLSRHRSDDRLRATCCPSCRPPSRGRRSPSPTRPSPPARPGYRLVLVVDSGARSRQLSGVRWRDAAGPPRHAGPLLSSMPSIVETTRRCPKRPPGPMPTARPIPASSALFRELFQVVFTDSPAYGRNLNGRGGMRK